MARATVPVRTTAAVFVKQLAAGVTRYIREPYNIVSLDYQDGTTIQTYIELTSGQPLNRLFVASGASAGERQEVYDDVKFYDSPPFLGTRVGYGSAGQ